MAEQRRNTRSTAKSKVQPVNDYASAGTGRSRARGLDD